MRARVHILCSQLCPVPQIYYILVSPCFAPPCFQLQLCLVFLYYNRANERNVELIISAPQCSSINPFKGNGKPIDQPIISACLSFFFAGPVLSTYTQRESPLATRRGGLVAHGGGTC
jgi:hypothetical protein